jgi:micrococcal nuclease
MKFGTAVLLAALCSSANAQSVDDQIRAEATPSDSGPRTPVRQTAECTITRIVDGDTVECNRVRRVRLIGIDTPELDQAPFGLQAATALSRVIPPGSQVLLERDVEPRDRYNRTLAYLWFNGAMVNWRMIRDGWAVLLTYPPNVQYVDSFTEAQRRARAENRGLWSSKGFTCLPADRRRGRCE